MHCNARLASSRLGRRPNRWILGCAVIALLTIPALAIDADRDGIDDFHEDTLLDRFAPEVRLKSNEANKPASVPWVLPRARLNFVHDGCTDHQLLGFGVVNETNLTGASHQEALPEPACSHTGPYLRSDEYDPPGRTGGFSLEFPESSWPGAPQRDWVTYGHVYPGLNGGVVLQYWFLYTYNDSIGSINHQGDWEHISVVLKPDETIERLIYARHGHSKSYLPHEVTLIGDRPLVYTAKGSHASYTGLGIFGGCTDAALYIYFIDRCDDTGVHWRTWDAGSFGGIVNVGERGFPRPGANWIRYSGLWGDVGRSVDPLKATSGPEGPAQQLRDWHQYGSPEICGNGIDDDVDGTVDETVCQARPDLTMTETNPALGQDGSPGRISVRPGETFPVRCGLDNLGTAVTGFFDVEFVLSLDRELDPSDIPLLGCLGLDGMPGSTSYPPIPTWDVTVPGWTPPGSYHVIGTADRFNVVDEGFYGENNNSLASEVRVTVLGAGGGGNLAGGEALLAEGQSAVGTEPLLENFADGLAQGFLPVRGDWDAALQSYVGSGLGTDRNDTVSLMSSDTPGAEIEFVFDVRESGGAAAPWLGAILRYETASRFLRVDTLQSGGGQQVRLVEADGGWPVVLAAATTALDLTHGLHQMRIVDTGCEIAVEIDEQLVLSSPYVSVVPTGQRGLFVNTGNTVGFDNFTLLSTAGADTDGDGWLTCAGDCNDQNPEIRPGRSEICRNSIDDDCSGAIDEGCPRGGRTHHHFEASP